MSEQKQRPPRKGEEHINTILELIRAGKTYDYISKLFQMSIGGLCDMLARPEYSARAKEARLLSAQTFADKAEQVLLNAEGTKEEIARARELAHHYRWRASKAAPKEFGEQLDVTTTNSTIIDASQVAALIERINAPQARVTASNDEDELLD